MCSHFLRFLQGDSGCSHLHRHHHHHHHHHHQHHQHHHQHHHHHQQQQQRFTSSHGFTSLVFSDNSETTTKSSGLLSRDLKGFDETIIEGTKEYRYHSTKKHHVQQHTSSYRIFPSHLCHSHNLHNMWILLLLHVFKKNIHYIHHKHHKHMSDIFFDIIIPSSHIFGGNLRIFFWECQVPHEAAV